MYRTGIYTVQAKYEIMRAVTTNYNGDTHPKSLIESPPKGRVAEVYSVSHLLKVNFEGKKRKPLGIGKPPPAVATFGAFFSGVISQRKGATHK
jgi:hypothetical protein